jgi:hypothetical protein
MMYALLDHTKLELNLLKTHCNSIQIVGLNLSVEEKIPGSQNKVKSPLNSKMTAPIVTPSQPSKLKQA